MVAVSKHPNDLTKQTGSVKTTANYMNWNALWIERGYVAHAPSAFLGAATIDLFASFTDAQAISYQSTGSYQLRVPGDAFKSNSITSSFPSVPALPPSIPEITRLSYDATTYKLTITGNNFTPPGQADSNFDLRVWLEPRGDQLSKISRPGTRPDRGIVWQSFTATPEAGNAVSIVVPRDVSLSMHNVYLERTNRVSGPTGRSSEGFPVDSDPVQFADLGTTNTLVTNADSIRVFSARHAGPDEKDANGNPAGFNPLSFLNAVRFNEKGQPLELYGHYSHQIAFSADGSLAFIAGAHSQIYVFDTKMQSVVYTLPVQNSTTNLSSLLVNENWLYATEGSLHTENKGRLIRINIDMGSPDFLKKQQVLDIQAIAPYGFQDMAINNGGYLGLTAPSARIPIPMGPGKEVGKVYVVDLWKVDDDGKVGSGGVVAYGEETFVNDLGRGPQFITSGKEAGKFLVSCAQNMNEGVVAIRIELDENGALTRTAYTNNPSVTPVETDKTWFLKQFQQNIQRSAGLVTVTYQGTEYGFVADFNLLMNDPHFSNPYAKEIGAKIGIIRDPFGIKGFPTYLGATTPVADASFEHLSISYDGFLYVDAMVEEQVDRDTTTVSKSLFVWDASQLITAAIAADVRRKSIPFDLDQEGKKQIVSPAKYDEAGFRDDFGWIYGIGTYLPPDTQVEIDKLAGTYPTITAYGTDDGKDGNPVDNVYTRAFGITAEDKARQIADGTFNPYTYAATKLLYNGWNLATLGFVERHGDRVKANNAGQLSDDNFWKAATVDGFATVASVVVGGRLGAGVTQRLGGGVFGALVEGGINGLGYSVVDQTGKIGRYYLANDPTGSRGFSVTELAESTVFGSALGGIGQKLLGTKFKWGAAASRSELPIRLSKVKTTANGIFASLKGSLAELTGASELWFKECFVAGTMIHTRDGMKPVEQIRIGDFVAARAEKTGETLWKPVRQLFCNEDKEILHITFQNAEMESETISVTMEHPFHVHRQGWIGASTLAKGNKIDLLKGGVAEITNIENRGKTTDVYNFEVTDIHNYFVGHMGIWVHNFCSVEWVGPGYKKIKLDLPKAGESTVVEAGKWLDENLAKIPGLINTDASLAAQAYQAIKLKNAFRQASINSLADVNASTQLFLTNPSRLWGDVVRDLKQKYSGKKLYQEIINFASKDKNLVNDMAVVARKDLPEAGLALIDLLGVTKTPSSLGVGAFIENISKTLARNDGILGEKLVAAWLGKYTHLEFRAIVNSANNGIDLIAIDVKNKTIWTIEVKSTIGDYTKNPDPRGTLYARTTKWLEDAKDGFIIDKNGKKGKIDAKSHALASQIDKLITDFGFSRKQLGASVWVPKPGQSGVARAELFKTESSPQLVLNQGPNVGVVALKSEDVNSVMDIAKQYWINAGANPLAVSNINVKIASLPSMYAGLTEDNQINLSADGAGWGWFVDTTPGAQEEFLSGGTANTYVARANGSAAGKLDLLTVLTHEMGHLLGLTDSDSDNAVLGEYLTPGVRRLPGAMDIKALQDQIERTTPHAITSTNGVQTLPPSLPANQPQQPSGYFEPNTTQSNSGANDGWQTGGAILVDGTGGVTLGESAEANAHFAQQFSYQDKYRYVSFTMADSALKANNSGPGDAFEVSLLNNNTGRSVIGAIDMSRSDAALNLQADGTESAASSVHKVHNIDGTTTYYIDLKDSVSRGDLISGAPVTLSFDLIGFGAEQSQIKLRDISLLQNPLAFDDRVATDEDVPISINVLANDLTGGAANATAPQLRIVNQPAHGSVSINPDGTLYYTPGTLYRGSDSFSYEYTVDGVTSNIATVNIAMRPVNHVPTGVSGHTTLVAGKSWTFNPFEGARDLDGDLLTVVVDTEQMHGTLVKHAADSWTYTPDYSYVGPDQLVWHYSDGQASSLPVKMDFTVLPSNTAPEAHDAAVEVLEDGSMLIDFAKFGTDRDNDTLAVRIASSPAHGTLVQQDATRYLYTPDPLFHDIDTVRFVLNDGKLDSHEAVLSISVQHVNHAPTAAGLLVATYSNSSITKVLPVGDIDRDLLSFDIATPAEHGQVTINADGTFTYQPNPNYHGPDSFVYTVSDGQLSAQATVTIDVQNHAPTAAGLSVALYSNSTITQAVTVADEDHDLLTFGIATPPAHGEVRFNADGTFTYQPNPNYHGPDSFIYTVFDGQLSAQATVNIDVQNHAPTAAGLSVALYSNSTITQAVTVADEDHDLLTFGIATPPAHGEVRFNDDGTFTYKPNPNYHGPDSFIYTVFDGQLSAQATVNIDVQNHAPTAAGLSVALYSNSTITKAVTVADEDHDLLTFGIATPPAHGEVMFNADGTFTYKPNPNYHGPDSFIYTVFDGQLSAQATVNIDVQNHAPTAAGLSVALYSNSTITQAVTVADEDHDLLTFGIATPPAHGEVTFNADGTFTYQPNPNYHGTDSFVYTVFDGQLSAQATVNIDVQNHAPTAAGLSVALYSNSTITKAVTVADEDHDLLTFGIAKPPTHGEVRFNADGTFTYKPNPNYHGKDSFIYTVSDGQLSAQATVNIDVQNHAPTADVLSLTLDQNGSITSRFPVADLDKDQLTNSIVTQPAHGKVTINPDGTFTYQPASNYSGNDSFTYKTNDGAQDSNVASVSLTIVNKNHAPTASDSVVQGREDTALTLRWSDFAINDADGGDVLKITLTALPADGNLQRQVNGNWIAAKTGDQLTRADLDAGLVRFIPLANASGGSDYSASGYGNMRQHYARIGFTVSDGTLVSGAASVNIDIAAIADAPTLRVSDIIKTTRELFRTSWESVANVDSQSTLAVQSQLEGWNLVTGLDQRGAGNGLGGGRDGFEVWTSGDRADANGILRSVQAASGNGQNFLELNDAGGNNYQTLGIERKVSTIAGAAYTFSFDLAGRAGYNANTTRIGVYVDGVKVATRDDTSGNALDWHNLAINFVGTGGNQTIRIVTEATEREAGGRGMMLDNLALSETVVQPQQRELFRTGWESAATSGTQSTLISGSLFDGWNLVTGIDRGGNGLGGGKDGFEIWSSGNQMADNRGYLRTVQAAANDGKNWLELNDAGGSQAQTLGISRQVNTLKGASYTLAFDLAGRIGFDGNTTRIGVYVDGVKQATFDNTSPANALAWQHASINFVGTGGAQTIRIVTEASDRDQGGRGMMIDEISLTEAIPLNRGVQGGSVKLQGFGATLNDLDGSETMQVVLAGFPLGTTVSDGTHSLTTSAHQPLADISGWNMQTLMLTPPANVAGKLTLEVIASATESASGSRASVSQALSIQIDAIAAPPNLTLAPRGTALSRLVINTGWDQGLPDWNTGPDVVWRSDFANWSMLPAARGKYAAFPIWQSNDLMSNALGKKVKVQGPAGSGADEAWVNLSNGVNSGTSYQALGMTQTVTTIADAQYTFNLNYAAGLGALAANSKIGVYLDDKLIGSYANTSSNTALNWQALSFNFKGDGQPHALRVQLEGSTTTIASNVMLTSIKLVETLPDTAQTVYGLVGGTVALPKIAATLAEIDPNGKLKTELLGLPVGATISDGTRYLTVPANGSLDLAGWDVNRLTLRVTAHCATSFSLQVRASSVETSGSSASTSRSFTVQILEGEASATPAGLNPYVSYVNNTAVTQSGGGITALLAAPLKVSGLLPEQTGYYPLSVPVQNQNTATGSWHNNSVDDDAAMANWMHTLEQSIGSAVLNQLDQLLFNKQK